MAKVYQGELPRVINVVAKGEIIGVARFIDGIYETDNKDIIAELKRYGYEVEEVKKKDTPKTTTVKPKPKPKKKDIK